jgi:Ser/Thr protein kinase RdoA (MazF antagonist)
MLKLKYLFNNKDLAYMLLNYWNHDLEDASQLDTFRISANAVYPYPIKGETNFLRFAPAKEKSFEYIRGELNYIKFLQENNYPVVEIANNRLDQELITANTPWGLYYAVSFKQVPGEAANELKLDYKLVEKFGESLGKLHFLSKMAPKFNRPSYKDILENIKMSLQTKLNQEKALEEVEILTEYFSNIKQTENNFGIIHYDFELDNAFYNKLNKQFYIYDFDDSMYNFFVMDINQALESIDEYSSHLNKEETKLAFINGYTKEKRFLIDDLDHIPACKRFANLYSYTRILDSISESWKNEPVWLVNLRKKLNNAIDYKSKKFGTKI